MTRLPFISAAALALLAAAGCARPPQQSRASAGAVAECRTRTEAAYNRQNRYLLSERDTTDSPFSTSGTTGITTQGLSQRYALDTQLSNCIKASGSNGPQDTGDGSAFSGSAAGRAPGPVSQ